MNKYRIVCTDVDGTLLNRDRELSSKTKFELKRITTEYSVPIILVSSRMPKAMRFLLKELDVNYPLISYNGALVLSELDEYGLSKTLFSLCIDSETTKKIFDFSKCLDVHTSIYHNDCWYISRYDSWAQREINNTKTTPNNLKGRVFLGDVIPNNIEAHKIMCMGDEDKITEIETYILTEFPLGINVYRSKPTYLELSHKRANKALGIGVLENYMHFKNADVIAFGDNLNDIEMLSYAGLSVAMGHSPQSVISISKKITLSNSQDGVAATIEELFD